MLTGSVRYIARGASLLRFRGSSGDSATQSRRTVCALSAACDFVSLHRTRANGMLQAFPVSVKAGGRAFSSSELTSEVASSIRVVQPSGELLQRHLRVSRALAQFSATAATVGRLLCNTERLATHFNCCAAVPPLRTEMPTTAAAGSLQVLDLQGGEAGDAPADARFLAAALGARVVMAPVSGAGAGAASDSSGAEAGAEAGAGAGAGAPRPSPRSAPVEVTVGDRGEEDPIAVGVAIAGARATAAADPHALSSQGLSVGQWAWRETLPPLLNH